MDVSEHFKSCNDEMYTSGIFTNDDSVFKVEQNNDVEED